MQFGGQFKLKGASRLLRLNSVSLRGPAPRAPGPRAPGPVRAGPAARASLRLGLGLGVTSLRSAAAGLSGDPAARNRATAAATVTVSD